MKKIVEFENCFLCKSCINKCPKNAIFLEEEKKGGDTA
jgi:NAD-dependent dihydropyrimidine dehydrogenase PreA subunit